MYTDAHLLAMFATHDYKLFRLYMVYICNVPINHDQLICSRCYSHFLNKIIIKQYILMCENSFVLNFNKLTVIIFGTIDTCLNRNVIFKKYLCPFWLTR